MAIISSYPTITPTSSDLVLVVDTSEYGNPTKTATIGSVNSLGAAPNIVTSTFTLTQAQLEDLGTTSITLLTLASNQYLQLISASVEETFVGDVGSSYTWDAAGVTLTYSTTPSTGYNRITIPTLALPDAPLTIKAPYTTAALDGAWRLGGDLIISTASNPSVAGTVTSATLTINLTYRLFPQT